MRFPWQGETQDTTTPREDAKTDFAQVSDIATIDGLLAGDGPSTLLIHDPFCPISDRAYSEAARLGGTVHLILTPGGRELTRHIAESTGIRHESPQAFVIAGGHVRWHASHGRIRRDAIAEALDAALESVPAETTAAHDDEGAHS